MNNLSVCSYRLYYDGADVWFVHLYLNLLVCISPVTGMEKYYVIPYPVDFTKCEPKYEALVFAGDEIWLIPANAVCFIVFNRKDESFRKIAPQIEGKKNNGRYSFSAGFYNQESIVLVPAIGRYLCKLDIDSECIRHIGDLSVYLRWNYGFIPGVNDDCIFITSGGSSDVLVYNMDRESFRTITTDIGLENGTETFTWSDGEYIYMVSNHPMDQNYRKVSISNGKTVKMIRKNNYGDNNTNYTALWYAGGGAVVIDYDEVPYFEIIDVDFDTRLMFDKKVRDDLELAPASKCGGAVMLDDSRFAYLDNTSNSFYVFEHGSGKLRTEKAFSVFIDDKTLDEIKKAAICSGAIPLSEKRIVDLKDFVSFI